MLFHAFALVTALLQVRQATMFEIDMWPSMRFQALIARSKPLQPSGGCGMIPVLTARGAGVDMASEPPPMIQLRRVVVLPL
jgi:hypothetical protein